ncbi:tRNA glutamyl-Q(34) synthetase GluQRS [Vibrio nigripulchritudo]|uniref:tRNA glutamyl-Q(34) synthetase GluQRS n=1 Tax=Vibrio nigripulchritudo TaxID=28173 RepID=UPI0024902217|nr:tRNA glutamyl-Q(34) synthetase GluQRS [Vibrio nigripulchritudo]BDU36134.1 glutamyl-Q tRNA(Asp) synthetase [Vibrio nigripulchritudo]BDU41790.1 glutamyl-Q tRNA(Asp) synthetase [Vibrio nigripulchritudo]
MITMSNSNYIGRFAPSPSGPLHFGSLIAALGSYFQARSKSGKWLVRMEDLDPPREMAGAADLILKTLDFYQLHWDGEVLFQSQRHGAYQQQIDQWLKEGLAYNCNCSRKQIKEAGGFYPGTCRHKSLMTSDPCAVRLTMTHPVTEFTDLRHGSIDIPPALAREDFIIKRRDELFAYNLAVVLDDIHQGVSEVVRGADLIEPTGRQISLYQMLKKTPIEYLHLPLAIDERGNKLSKQNRAEGISLDNPKPETLLAMRFLGFDLDKELEQASQQEILRWGVENWHLNQLPDEIKITSPFSNKDS